MKAAFLIALVGWAGVAALAQTPAKAPASAPVQKDGPDIIGLRLGMTEPQVIAVLRAYNPGVQFRPVVDAMPTPAATRFTTTLYAGIYGDDRAGIGDEIVKLVFTNPTPVARVMGIWRKQSFPQGRELTVANTLAAFRDKYGPAPFVFTATGRTTWAWATGVGARQPQSYNYCIRSWGDMADPPSLGIVVNTFIEPRAYSNTPDCGVSIGMEVHDVRGLVDYISTSLIDHPAAVRAREEFEEMSKRPDPGPTEADRRGRPAL